MAGVDPLDPDSDGDGIIDSEDPEPTTPQASEEPIWDLSFGSVIDGSAKFSRRAVLGALLGEAGVEYSGTIRSALSAGVRSQQLKQYLLGKGGYSLAEFWELTSSDTTIPFEESDTESLAYVAGWIMAGFVPVAGALADVRDCLVLTDSATNNALDCGFAAVSVVLSAGTIASVLAGGPLAPALAGGAVLADTAQSATKAIKITAKAIKKGLVRPDRIVRWVYHNVQTSVLKQVNFAQKVASRLGERAGRLVKESADDAKAQQRLVADGGLNEKLARAITKADVSDELAITIKNRISNFDEISGFHTKTRLIEQLARLDEPVKTAERLGDISEDTLEYITRTDSMPAAARLLDDGLSSSRLTDLSKRVQRLNGKNGGDPYLFNNYLKQGKRFKLEDIDFVARTKSTPNSPNGVDIQLINTPKWNVKYKNIESTHGWRKIVKKHVHSNSPGSVPGTWPVQPKPKSAYPPNTKASKFPQSMGPNDVKDVIKKTITKGTVKKQDPNRNVITYSGADLPSGVDKMKIVYHFGSGRIITAFENS